MRSAENVFHLAIPCRDLDESREFYVDRLGCRLARRYDDRITLDFFGDQLVCHLAPDDIDATPRLYPRHFGITFREQGDFERVLHSARTAGVEILRDVFTRFDDKPERHRAFFLVDPSHNVLEFKHYPDSTYMY